MKVLAVIINIFLPGIGTLCVKKWGQAIIQVLMYWGGIAMLFGGFVGLVLGASQESVETAVGGAGITFFGSILMFAAWLWAIISAVTANDPQQQIVIIQQHADGSMTRKEVHSEAVDDQTKEGGKEKLPQD